MPLKVDYKTLFFSLLGIFLFSCINSTHFYILSSFLLSKGFNGEQVEQLSQNRLAGLIITAFALTQLINKFSNKKIILISLVILIISITNLIIFNGYNIIKLNLIIMSGATFAYLATIIMRIIESTTNRKYLFLAFIIFLWSVGHIIVVFLNPLLKSTNHLMIFGALFYFINILTETLHIDKTPHNSESNSKFSLLIRNIELQLLTGLIIAYVIFETLWYYEAFAFKYQLSLINSNVILNYIYISMSLSIVPMSYILSKVNKYLANLLLILIILFCFILLPFYGIQQIWNASLIMIVGICLGAIFICNLLILLDKFKAYDLRTAIFSYFSMCSIGIYGGALSSSSSYGSINDGDLLFSILAVVGTFAVYYFWYFIKYKLYRR